MGIDEETLADLGRWRESSRFTPLDKLALELAEAMTANPADVSDDLRARLAQHLAPAQVTELASAIAWENHRARLNRALGVKEMGFSDGAFCVLPHRPGADPNTDPNTDPNSQDDPV
jgi:alkylhydroperoxidase family enzyme